VTAAGAKGAGARRGVDPFAALDALAARLGPAFRGLGPADFASPKPWSRGAVDKVDVISHRTGRPEHRGVRCAKTFGPLVDDACLCGKYRGAECRGVRCEKCGVDVGSPRARGERFGHVALAAPVPHPWFCAHVAAGLGLSPEDFGRVATGEAGLVAAVNVAGPPVAPGEVVATARLVDFDAAFGPGAVSASAGPEALAARSAGAAAAAPAPAPFAGSIGAFARLARSAPADRAARADLAARAVAPRALWLDVLPVLPPGLREPPAPGAGAPRDFEAQIASLSSAADVARKASLAATGLFDDSAERDEARRREHEVRADARCREVGARARALAEPRGLDALYVDVIRRNEQLAEVRRRGLPSVVTCHAWRALRDAVGALFGPCDFGPRPRRGRKLVDLLAARLAGYDPGDAEAVRAAARLLFALGLWAPACEAAGLAFERRAPA
jgi:hypothetical protein